MDKNILTISEASKILGASISSLRRWDDAGVLKPIKTAGKHRRYLYSDLLNFINNKGNIINENDESKVVIAYARVSSSDQKDDLERQANKLKDYCESKGFNYRIIKDLGSGLNYNKKGLKQLINLICNKEVDRIVLTYKDRLIRYGYEMILEICKINNVTIDIIEDSPTKTYEQELVEDVLSIITVFSSKLYGSRSSKKKTEFIETATKYFTKDKKII